MATYYFDGNVGSLTEFKRLYDFLHQYNLYMKEHPTATINDVRNNLRYPGLGSALYGATKVNDEIANIKRLTGGVMPTLADEQDFLDQFKTFAENKKNAVETERTDANEAFTDPSRGIGGKSLEDIELDAEDAKTELRDCRWGRSGIWAGILTAAVLVAGAVLLPGAAFLAGGALAVPAFAGNAVALGALGGGGFLAHRASKKLNKRIEDAKKARKLYRRHEKRIDNAKTRQTDAENDFNNFNRHFRGFETVDSLYNTKVNQDIADIGARLHAIESTLQTELNGCVPDNSRMGYAEAVRVRAQAQAELRNVQTAITNYNNLRSSSSLDLTLYMTEMTNAITAETAFNGHNLTPAVSFLDRAEAQQRAVITATNAVEAKFNAEKPVLSGLTLGGIERSEARDAFNDLKDAVDFVEGVFAGFTTTMSNDAIFRDNATFKRDYEDEAKETYFQYRVTYSQAWQKFTESVAVAARINSNVGSANGLTTAEKNDYDRVARDLAGYNTQIATMNTDATRRDECERYVVGAEIKAGLIRAYSELQKARAAGDVTKITDIEAEIVHIKALETAYANPGADIVAIRNTLVTYMATIETLLAGRFVVLPSGERVLESNYDSRIGELVRDLDPLVERSKQLGDDMENRRGVYSDKVRERSIAKTDIRNTLADIQALINAKRSIVSSYDEYRTERDAANIELATVDPAEKKYTIDSVNYYTEMDFIALRSSKSTELLNKAREEAASFNSIQTEFPNGAPDTTDPDYTTKISRYNQLVNERNTKASELATLATELETINNAFGSAKDPGIDTRVSAAKARATNLVQIPGVKVFRESDINAEMQTIREALVGPPGSVDGVLKQAQDLYTDMQTATGTEYTDKLAERRDKFIEMGRGINILNALVAEKQRIDSSYSYSGSEEEKAIQAMQAEYAKGMPAEKTSEPTVKVGSVEYTQTQLEAEIQKQLGELDGIVADAKTSRTATLPTKTDPAEYTTEYNRRQKLITEDGITERLTVIQGLIKGWTDATPAGFGRTAKSEWTTKITEAETERDATVSPTPTKTYTDADVQNKLQELENACKEEHNAMQKVQNKSSDRTSTDYSDAKTERDAAVQKINTIISELRTMNATFSPERDDIKNAIAEAEKKASNLVEIENVAPFRESEFKQAVVDRTTTLQDKMRDLENGKDPGSGLPIKRSHESYTADEIKALTGIKVRLEAVKSEYEKRADKEQKVVDTAQQTIEKAQQVIDQYNASHTTTYEYAGKTYTEGEIKQLIAEKKQELDRQLIVEEGAFYILSTQKEIGITNPEYINNAITARKNACTKIERLADELEKINSVYPDSEIPDKVAKARAQASPHVEIENVPLFREAELERVIQDNKRALLGALQEEEACLVELTGLINKGGKKAEGSQEYIDAKNNRQQCCDEIKKLADALDALDAKRKTPEVDLKKDITDPARARASALIEWDVVRVANADGKKTARLMYPCRESELSENLNLYKNSVTNEIKNVKTANEDEKSDKLLVLKYKSAMLEQLYNEKINRATDKDSERESLKEYLEVIEKAKQFIKDNEIVVVSESANPEPPVEQEQEDHAGDDEDEESDERRVAEEEAMWEAHGSNIVPQPTEEEIAANLEEGFNLIEEERQRAEDEEERLDDEYYSALEAELNEETDDAEHDDDYYGEDDNEALDAHEGEKDRHSKRRKDTIYAGQRDAKNAPFVEAKRKAKKLEAERRYEDILARQQAEAEQREIANAERANAQAEALAESERQKAEAERIAEQQRQEAEAKALADKQQQADAKLEAEIMAKDRLREIEDRAKTLAEYVDEARSVYTVENATDYLTIQAEIEDLKAMHGIAYDKETGRLVSNGGRDYEDREEAQEKIRRKTQILRDRAFEKQKENRSEILALINEEAQRLLVLLKEQQAYAKENGDEDFSWTEYPLDVLKDVQEELKRDVEAEARAGVEQERKETQERMMWEARRREQEAQDAELQAELPEDFAPTEENINNKIDEYNKQLEAEQKREHDLSDEYWTKQECIAFIENVERYNQILEGLSPEGRAQLLPLGGDIVKTLNEKLEKELPEGDEVRIRGLKAIERFGELYDEARSATQKLEDTPRLEEAKIELEPEPQMSFEEMMARDSGLTPTDKKAIEAFAIHAKKKIEELKANGVENPEEQVAEQLLPKNMKTPMGVRVMRFLIGDDENVPTPGMPYEKPTIETKKDRHTPTFEYLPPEEADGAIVISGAGSKYAEYDTPLRFELNNPEKRAEALLEEAQKTLEEIQGKLEEMQRMGASQQSIMIIQQNVIVIQGVQDGLKMVNGETSIEDVKRLEDSLSQATEQANVTVINALGEYEERYSKLKAEIQGLKNDLKENAKLLRSYGVDALVKLSTVAMFENSMEDLAKNKSVEGLVRLGEYVGKFQAQLQKTINERRPENSVSRAGDAGVKDNAARCLLEGAIEQFAFYKQVEGLISHDSKVGKALLDTVVIKGSESILNRTESYTVSRDGKKVVYQVPELDMKHEQTRHNDEDSVNLEYLGEAIVNATSYIVKDRERRDEFRQKKGVQVNAQEEKEGQIKLRNYIIKTFNGQVLNGTGKKISLTFEGRKPIVTVEGGELTYAELRKLDKIIESQMYTESGRRKGGDEFPPQEF